MDESIRIPISLKFEKDEMYLKFIQPARDDRSLTQIITTLLRAYYEDEEVRKLVDARELGEEMIRELNDEIWRIESEHNKSVAQISAIKFDAEAYRSDLPKTASKTAAVTPSATMESLMAIVTSMQAKMDNMEKRVDKAGIPLLIEGASAVDTDTVPNFDELLEEDFELIDLWNDTEGKKES